MDIDNKILKYVEGRLIGQEKENFESLINSDSEFFRSHEAIYWPTQPLAPVMSIRDLFKRHP